MLLGCLYRGRETIFVSVYRIDVLANLCLDKLTDHVHFNVLSICHISLLYTRNAAASGGRTSYHVRCFTTDMYASKPQDSTMEKSYKGHSMLAPFTAGWQTADTDPLVIEKSEGCYVYDSNGKKYLDSLAGLWCTALGGNEPRLIDAATKQLKTLPFYHSFWNRTTKVSLDLADELLETFTARKMAKAFFVNSGSEANDTQVKLVWYYNNALGRPNKKKFIARSKSYHGSTLIAASLTGLPALHQQFDLPAPFVLHTDCPHYWRYHLPGETEEDFATRLAKNLEDLILKEGPETIAAFIAEPVMGAGGVIPPPATYFDKKPPIVENKNRNVVGLKIQAVVKKYDILFIADEVVCAFGRLGEMFGSDKYNIKPDLVSLAKALSSAYMPIGAVLVSPEISEVIHSQSNKLVSCAVALEALKLYKYGHPLTETVSCVYYVALLGERNIVERARSLTPKFQDGLRAYTDSPIIGEIRGTGLIMGTEFTENKSPNDPFPAEWGVGAYFGAQCQKNGMLVRVAGDSIMLCPPLSISEGELDEVLISKYGQALKDTEARVKELKAQKK
ncbi:hypothetical protein KSS87_007541 [Heliosperma pusillum]|nr:hypothetical protein KSS87_007541 [Heliosperma pusillum]